MDAVHAALDQTGLDATLDEVADAIEAEAPDRGKTREVIERLACAVRSTSNLRLATEDATVIEMASGGGDVPVDWSSPGLYRLDLVDVHSAVDRIQQTGAVAHAVLAHAKTTRGEQPLLLVVDEAQNYAPSSRPVASLAPARPSSRCSRSPLKAASSTAGCSFPASARPG
jgi:hypothetical protein